MRFGLWAGGGWPAGGGGAGAGGVGAGEGGGVERVEEGEVRVGGVERSVEGDGEEVGAALLGELAALAQSQKGFRLSR